MARIGLVAGYGTLPVIFSDAARKKSDIVIAFALKGVTQEELAQHVDKIHWFEWGSLKKALFTALAERVTKIAMLGKIKKELIFKDNEKLDEEAKKILEAARNKKDYAILKSVSALINSMGIEVIDPTAYLEDLVPQRGTLTRREPTADEWADIRYGVDVAKELSGFDVGQTVAVKDKTALAVEAAEGTDACIQRAGELNKGGFVVVKVARPDQDMRFDIPLIGLGTLKTLLASGGRVLALEEKKTLLMNKDEVVKLADAKGISVVVI